MARALRLSLILALLAAIWLAVDARRRDVDEVKTPAGPQASAAPELRGPAADPHGAELQAIRALPAAQEAEAIARYEALLKNLDGDRRRDMACELAVRLHNRAVRHAQAHERQAAEVDSARALSLCPDEKRIKETRAGILASFAGKEDRATSDGRKRAIDLLERSLALDEEPNALALMAELLYANDDVAGAVTFYDRALAKKDTASWRERLADFKKKAAVEGSFSDRRHQHFVARFEGYGQEKLAWVALDALEDAYFSIGRDLDLYPKEPFTVLIYTGDQYQRAIDVPDWSTGVFDGKIRIAQGQLALEKGQLESILRHEFTHAALSTLPCKIPTWMNEGLAEHFEGSDAARARAHVVSERNKGHAVTWDELQGAFVTISDATHARLAYSTSTALVAALIEARGIYAIATFITQLENGATFEDAFASTFATTPKTHFERWLSQL